MRSSGLDGSERVNLRWYAHCMPKAMRSAGRSPSAVRVVGGSLAEDLSFLLARANAISLAASNAALAAHGLRVRSYSVLALVSAEERPSQRELAEFLRLDPSQIVALVDDLQGRGLVAREPDPNDRRANVVVSTARGRELCERAQQAARSGEQALHAGLTAAQRTQLAELLRVIAFSA